MNRTSIEFVRLRRRVEHLEGQIQKVADVILKVCPQMVLEGEGACDTAARLIQTHWECWE